MKRGDVINGYRILEDKKMTNAGLSLWSFAEKGGKQYFIKEFLDPKYPSEDAPGSPATKEHKRQKCQEFEAHQQELQKALKDKSMEGGNLIVPRDFFRSGSQYYKVTEKVDTSNMTVQEVSLLSLSHRLVILRTIALALQILHRQRIVHGDLKPTNILIKSTDAGGYAAKLIDFDSSYISGNPPDRENVVGDQVYLAPETVNYIAGNAGTSPSDLTTATDIFALGLIYHQFLVGQFPQWDKKLTYASEALLNGKAVTVNLPKLPDELAKLISAMLQPDYHMRPDAAGVIATLKKIPIVEPPLSEGKLRTSRPMEHPDVSVPHGTAVSDTHSAGLKGSLTHEDKGTTSEEKPPRLKGTLLKRD